MSTQEYDGLKLESVSLKEQLVSCLEELASREREVAELHDTSLKYHSKMQTFADQVQPRRWRCIYAVLQLSFACSMPSLPNSGWARAQRHSAGCTHTGASFAILTVRGGQLQYMELRACGYWMQIAASSPSTPRLLDAPDLTAGRSSCCTASTRVPWTRGRWRR